ncbi:MAG: glucose-6-phosphate isomerase [Erysipelotrichaceae bacterium]|nr:glucose-6-phosphate isomerase [Erysipelotrichaceae bacterium]
MKIVSSGLFFEWQKALQGDCVEKAEKKYEAVSHMYKEQDPALNGTTMYTVYSIEEPPLPGHLLWGLSVLHPVTVQGECNMTRGHFHQDRQCQEYYWCMQGEGLLMLMDEQGHCWAEEMKEGTLHKIDGTIAHRLVNTGDCDLEVVACWPSTSGHDYEAIEEKPFPIRVFKKGDQLIYEQL